MDVIYAMSLVLWSWARPAGLAQGSEVQSQRVSEKLTRTVALQRVQSVQETMICSILTL